MEVIVNEKKTEEKEYPYLGINLVNKTIILFIKEKEGIVLKSELPVQDFLGDYGVTWQEDRFVKFEGEIILRNS